MKKTILTLSLIATSLTASTQTLARSYVEPTRIVWISDTTGRYIKNSDALLKPFSGQVSVASKQFATLRSDSTTTASVLLDFGRELHGGLKISSAIREQMRPLKLRIRLGESVTEAMSDVTEQPNRQNATNEHSLRDATIEVPWLGSTTFGNSGFRFARIDLLDKDTDYPIANVSAILEVTDADEKGSFKCDDDRLTRIWNTGAYTVKLNMQDFLWDGIKRDRLVWLGDMHPEVMTIGTVFGNHDVVKRSLDFAVADTPLPGWMNGMCSYSLWWIIIQRDLYLQTGDISYLKSTIPYMTELVRQIDSKIDKSGFEHLDGTRFIDWPTSENEKVINSGLQALTTMALRAAVQTGEFVNDKQLVSLAGKSLRRASSVRPDNHGNSQAAALNILAGLSDDIDRDCRLILENGIDDFTTFYGYYMLEALAMGGYIDEALELISKYWGAMLDLGATTFWEDLKFSDTKNAGRIDEITPEGKHDIHADGGAYCYKGLRLSLCHGWASGPTPWLTRHVLGIRPLEPGCRVLEVKPNLGRLNYAEGSYPTPYGTVNVSVKRNNEGKIECTVESPDEIQIRK